MISPRYFLLLFIPITLISGYAQVVSANLPNYKNQRASLVARLNARGIQDKHVLSAMNQVPRHLFIASTQRNHAYDESEIAVGYGRVMWRPYMVALIVQHLNLKNDSNVLQVGADSGYLTAVLATIAPRVSMIDVQDKLVRSRKKLLRSLGYHSISLKSGRACKGWSEQGPFDVILVVCAVDHIPQCLVDQLKEDGCLVIAVGSGPEQTLNCLHKSSGKITSEAIAIPDRIAPMICKPTIRSKQKGNR